MLGTTVQIAGTSVMGKCDENLPSWKTVADFSGSVPPMREWLAHEWIPIGQPTLLYGDGGTGKSLLALQLCASVALNIPWLGMSVKSGRSIYFTAEDDEAELHRRIEKICQSFDVNIANLSDMKIASMVGLDALFVTHDTTHSVLRPTPLLEHIEAKIQSEQPALVVFDTLADIFAGDETHWSLSRQFISMMRTLAYENNCAVLILAHPSKAGMYEKSGTSGSTGWSNSARSRIYLTRPDPDNPDLRTLENMKNNYAQIGKSLQLQWQNGCFIADGISASFANQSDQVVEDIFLEILDDQTMKGIRLNANSGSNYAPAIFATHPLANGITKPAFLKAMRNLMQAGKIGNVKDKRSSYIRRLVD